MLLLFHHLLQFISLAFGLTWLQADAVEAAASREGWAEEALALTRFTYAELLTEVATRLRRERPHEAVTMGWRLLTASPAGMATQLGRETQSIPYEFCSERPLRFKGI
jgi:hypothetical protein